MKYFIGAVFGMLGMCVWGMYWQNVNVSLWWVSLAAFGAGALFLALVGVCACIVGGWADEWMDEMDGVD